MDPVAAHLERARNAILACDYAQAVVACQQALADHPRHVEAALLLAEALREQSQFQTSEDLLRRVLSSDPESVLAYWSLGLLLRDQGRDEEALAMLSIGRELAPGNTELVSDVMSLTTDPRAAVAPTRALLGRYYASAGLYGRAADEFRAVLSSQPRRLDVWVALAESLWHLDDQIQAREVCEAILAEAPHCLKPLVILARIHALDGDESTASALLALAHELDPADATIGKLN